MKITIRPFEEADRPFVMHSWLNSWAANRSRLERMVPMARALAGHRRCVEAVIEGSVLRIGVVRPAEQDGDIIVGWICAEPTIEGGPGVLHYAFVKRRFRGHGVFRALLEDVGPLAFTSSSDVIAKKIGTQKLKLGWAPGLLYYPAIGEREAT